jgi:hypothetical protein
VPYFIWSSKYLTQIQDGLPIIFGDILLQRHLYKFDGKGKGYSWRFSFIIPLILLELSILSVKQEKEGGSLSTTGLVEVFRTDVDYGTKIGDGLYHVGGFTERAKVLEKTGLAWWSK